jgi:hypothetical protein
MTAIDLSAWGEQPPLFVRLLAVEAAATTKTQAGQRIGMSRSAVSLILINRYPSPSTAHVERRVMETLGRLECVALDEVITTERCQSQREKPAPTHNPYAMHSWRACQHCVHNPHCQNQENHHA